MTNQHFQIAAPDFPDLALPTDAAWYSIPNESPGKSYNACPNRSACSNDPVFAPYCDKLHGACCEVPHAPTIGQRDRVSAIAVCLVERIA